jgi:hypothetical protein
MTVHLSVLPEHLTRAVSKDGAPWIPKERFSPSQFATADRCLRRWAFPYLFGVREAGKQKGTMLGSLIHACLEHYLHGGTVYDLVATDGTVRAEPDVLADLGCFTFDDQRAMVQEAPKRALVAVEYLPRLQECDVIEVEQWISIDTRRINAGIEPIHIVGKIDLRVRRGGHWYVYDHKSTRGRRRDPWAYIKSPETLLTDPQGVFYALDTMHKHGQRAVWNRWTYTCTDPEVRPVAKPVDFEAHLEAAERAAAEWLILAVEMQQFVRDAASGTLTPDDVPATGILPPHPRSPCLEYGRYGCPYRAERGGPCRASSSLNFGSMILQTPDDQGVPDVNLAEKLAAARHTNRQNAIALGAPLALPEAVPVAPAPMSPLPPPATAVPSGVWPSGVWPSAVTFNPPEAPPPAPPPAPTPAAPAAPTPAPVALPPLPPGWEYDANNFPRPVAVAPATAPPAPPVAPPPPAPPVAPPPAPPAAAPPAQKKRGRKSKAEKEAVEAAALPPSPIAPPAPAFGPSFGPSDGEMRAADEVRAACVEVPPPDAPEASPTPRDGIRLKIKATFADGSIIEVPCPVDLATQAEAAILALFA